MFFFQELQNIDNDVKAKFNQYNAVKSNLAALRRKQTGNLATKSLTPIVDPSLLVQDSEYLETHLIAVPTNARKDFLKRYETLAPMVVPRSSIQVAQDDEFTLFAVTTFKKHGAEFVAKCREQKWTPRQYKYVEGGREEEQRELDRVAKEEKKVWGEALRLGRTQWSESVMIWAHVMTLRVFVETVLRYGLPLEFVAALVKVCLCRFFFLHICLCLRSHADHAKKGRQREEGSRLGILVPRRQRFWPGQAWTRHQGRCNAQLRDGSGRSRRRRRVHSLCVL
jgi:V-type H+-transporting ATPase subunit C